MFERISLAIGRLLTASIADLKREDGQGATEYAMVIAFVIVGLTVGLGALGVGIGNFLDDVKTKLDALIP